MNLARKTNIFHNTSLKLTAIYLSILMVISLLFSIGLYRVSAQEVERLIRRESPTGKILRSRNPELIADWFDEQDEAVTEAKSRIQNSLVLINLIIFGGGGLLSYVLARRTLAPIEQAHEAQSRFTADAAHELRTPITAMRAETELTLTDDTLTLAKARTQLASNIEELDKLTDLSDGLLQLARLDETELDISATSLRLIIEQATENVISKAHKKQQTIDLPDQENLARDVEALVNKAAIIQLLTILLENAVKYSPRKSTITVATTQSKKSISISVNDTGIGIRATDLPHIFDRFYRADNSRSKTDVKGYGIGLSIAKSIADLHHAQLTATSTPDSGSTFTLTLDRHA